MKEMADNNIGIYRKFDALVEFSTKIMHSATTSLYFLQVDKAEKDLGKERKTTRFIYDFLAEG